MAIVSMVAAYDVQMYILAVKSLYRRLGRGKIVAILDGVSEQGRDLIAAHLGPVEFVPIHQIDTGACPRGGTWERLAYIIDRSAKEYVIQIDADVLCVGPVDEVLQCVEQNRAFTLADGIEKQPLSQWVRHGMDRQSDNVVIDFEKHGNEFPDADRWSYVRGSSGFTGFAKGAMTRADLERFHLMASAVMKDRWKEWGTEQIASNFMIANSPDSLPLPKPKYLSYENHELTPGISLLHFLGYCRFNHGIFQRHANTEIDAMLGR